LDNYPCALEELAQPDRIPNDSPGDHHLAGLRDEQASGSLH